MTKETKIQWLEYRINLAIQRGNGTAGVIRKWEREIRNLSK